MATGGELHITCRPVPKTFIDFTTPAPSGSATSPAAEGSILTDAQYTADVEVVFQDTGVGIPAAEVDQVFTPFWTKKPQGTGLGLALTHKMIEEHGGTIHLTSLVGHGTTVTVRLPLTPPSLSPLAQIS